MEIPEIEVPRETTAPVALLKALTQTEKDELVHQAAGGVMAAQRWLEAEHAVVIAAKPLEHWLYQERTRRFAQRIRDGRRRLQTLERAAGSAEARFDPVILEAFRETLLDTLAQGQATTKSLTDLYELILRDRRQTIEERKVAVLERKAELAEAAEATARDSDLTAEEREARIREIFGLNPPPAPPADLSQTDAANAVPHSCGRAARPASRTPVERANAPSAIAPQAAVCAPHRRRSEADYLRPGTPQAAR